MKLGMKLTMDGLLHSLSAIARSMADEADWRYAGQSRLTEPDHSEARQRTAGAERHERGSN